MNNERSVWAGLCGAVKVVLAGMVAPVTVLLAFQEPCPAWADRLALEVEVLESGETVTAPSASAGSIRYALVHHAHPHDQSRLSEWLRTRSGASVAFQTGDGKRHPATLHRLKHCFGRGLLLYPDPVSLKEKEVVRLMLETAP